MADSPSSIVRALDAMVAIQQAISVTFEDGTVQQVVHAYPYGEWTVDSVNLPFFVNNVKGGETRFDATPALQDIADVIDMFLCLWPMSAGRSREQSMRYVLEWRDAVFAAFALNLRLGGQLGFVKKASIVKWDFGRYTIGQTEYWAIRFELNLGTVLALPVGL
jgi:hypothetical protein